MEDISDDDLIRMYRQQRMTEAPIHWTCAGRAFWLDMIGKAG